MFNENVINDVKVDIFVGGELEVEEQPMFWLPEYKLHFRCGNGAAFICNANTTVHCTTSPKPVGVLGMAFIQFRPLVVQLGKALKNRGGEVAQRYFEAKKRYIDERVSSSNICIENFISCNF